MLPRIYALPEEVITLSSDSLHVTVPTRRARKSNLLGRIRYLWNCSNFFAKFTAFTQEDSSDISYNFHCKYMVAFKNYNYLNLNVHFSK